MRLNTLIVVTASGQIAVGAGSGLSPSAGGADPGAFDGTGLAGGGFAPPGEAGAGLMVGRAPFTSHTAARTHRSSTYSSRCQHVSMPSTPSAWQSGMLHSTQPA